MFARWRNWSRIAFLILVPITGNAILTSKAYSDPAIPVGVTKEQLYGTMIKASRWQNPNIAVCWENPEDGNAHYLELTQQAVKDTWEKNSAVRFTGWGKCVKDAPGVHVRISDEPPHVIAVGRYLDTRFDGIILNFKFENWKLDCAETRDFCISAIAVHEFGHALGFTHEQKKTNVRAECSNEPNDIIGDYLVPKYDPLSIMSYCNPKWNGNGKLSKLDVEAVKSIYGG
jgi:hypothetical protein